MQEYTISYRYKPSKTTVQCDWERIFFLINLKNKRCCKKKKHLQQKVNKWRFLLNLYSLWDRQIGLPSSGRRRDMLLSFRVWIFPEWHHSAPSHDFKYVPCVNSPVETRFNNSNNLRSTFEWRLNLLDKWQKKVLLNTWGNL